MLLSADRLESSVPEGQTDQGTHADVLPVPDRAKMSIEDLQWCIGDMYDLRIEKFEVAFDSVFLYGMVERYPGRRASLFARINRRFHAVCDHKGAMPTSAR